MRVSFVVYERAAPQGSKRYVGNGIMIESSKRVKPFREAVKAAASNAHLPDGWPMDVAMRVGVRFHFQRPKAHYTSKGALKNDAPMEAISHRLGDIEKLARAVNDSLSGTVFNDDRQVVEMHLAKCYDDQDLVTISIESLE